jgi:ribonuclease D
MFRNFYFTGHTGTIQVGTRTAVFIIDAVGEFNLIMEHIKPMLENPGILKLMWGIGGDVQYLRKDFQTNLTAVIDLQQLMMMHENQDQQLKLETACKILLTDYVPPTDCTNAHWIRDKRPKAWVEYAGADVVTLFPIWDYLAKAMESSQVAAAVLQTKSLILKTYTPRGQLKEEKALEAGRELYKGKSTENVSITFPVLFQWRDYLARIVDEKPELLISNQLLYALSTENENLSDEKMQQLGLPRIIINTYSKDLN